MPKKSTTAKKRDIPWEQLYEYVLVCGQEHDPYRFAVRALDELGELIPFDQGLAWCLDENRHVCEQHLINIQSRWTTMYIEYYSQLQGDRRSLRGTANESYGLPKVEHIIWDHEPQTEFIRNYIGEREVVDLMCQGFSPAHVASSLRISTSTAYKHIAHIYKKLHVSSQQELLVRVLGNRESGTKSK